MASWDSYADDVDALKSELENLVETRNHVMRRINIAEEGQQQMMLPTNEVQLWFSRVQDLETEVGELIQQAFEEIDKLHPGGFCSGTFNNRSSSYDELEDMVADKLQAVMNLIEEGAAFLVDNEVPVVTTPKDVGDESKIVGMESLFDEVCKCLQFQEEEDDDDDDNDDDDEEEEKEYEGGGGEVGIVGIYGMGGVGKTTLLKQIYNNLLLDLQNKFGVVIWVSVSKDLRVEKIQEQIGMKIGLFDKVWRKKSLKDKASDIFKILKEKKFVLLMDGLWERVDLAKVGVPLPDSKNLSKIVFTTRSIEICSLMEAHRQFQVKCLAEEEAWKLFQTLVGEETLHDGHPEVLCLARDISKECCGLPLALVRIGQAMDGKQTAQEWRDVLEVLRRLRSSISGSDDELKKDIYYQLKLSYDNLQNDLFKTCLLYCCLFPRHYRMCKRDLIDCWIGEGFLDDRLGAQMQGYYIIDVLLSASLLEEDDNYVKMHNWIHDMSLWVISEIEKEKRNFFICTKAGLTELPEIESWKDVTKMSVVDNRIKDLIDVHEYPHLQTLFLNSNLFKAIPRDFFQFMHCLKVLNLSNNIFLQELPTEISKLVSLQHLDLSCTGIESLPNQLGALKKLKCLNLELTWNLHTIPRGLISKFAMLHVLRLWECGVLNNQSAEDNVACNDAQLLIQELLGLKNLGMLSITLRNSHALQKLLSSYGLRSCTQSLWLQLLRHPKSITVSLTYLKHLNSLQISDCKCLEELEVDFVGKSQAVRESPHSFNFLQKVLIDNCPNLWDLTCLILAPNLKHLLISECSVLEEIIKVGKLSECPELLGKSTPFSKLEILRLSKLPNLRSIYWSDLPFPELKKSTITDCPKLQVNLPPCLFNQDDRICGSESEEHGMEITSLKEVDLLSEPSALNRKAMELNIGSWSPEGDTALQQVVHRDSLANRFVGYLPISLNRPRLVWTPQLHKRFFEAVARLGIKNAVPKTILQLMSADRLTIEDVDSHLQKYRLYLKKMQASSGAGGAFSDSSAAASASSATDRLFATTPIPPHFLSTVEESESEAQSMDSTVTQKVEPSGPSALKTKVEDGPRKAAEFRSGTDSDKPKKTHKKSMQCYLKKKVSPVQRMYNTCKDVFAFSSTGIVPSPEKIQQLRAVLDDIKLEDVGLHPDMPYFRKTTAQRSPQITYLHIHGCDNFSIGIFCLPPSGVIPLHNHPGMTGFNKLLFGTMHIKSYDWVVDVPGNTTAVGNPSEKWQPEMRLAKAKVNSEFTAPCNTSILYPADGGNMHCFTAVTACAVLDVLGPPYSDPDGRHCTYYLDFPFTKFPVDGVSVPEEDKEGYAWLQEMEIPEEFAVVGAVFMGPKIEI